MSRGRRCNQVLTYGRQPKSTGSYRQKKIIHLLYKVCIPLFIGKKLIYSSLKNSFTFSTLSFWDSSEGIFESRMGGTMSSPFFLTTIIIYGYVQNSCCTSHTRQPMVACSMSHDVINYSKWLPCKLPCVQKCVSRSYQKG